MINEVHTTLFRFAQTFDFTPLPKRAANDDLLQSILTLVLSVVGGIAIIIIIIGGIQYASSQGDPKSTSRAKQTVLYAIVGLLLAIFARVIVAFVFGRIA